MANPKTATFSSAGKISQHTIPGGVSRFTTATVRLGLADASNTVFLGVCDNGPKSATLKWYADLDDVKNNIEGTVLLEIFREAFDPGADYIPSRLGLIRVNNATQATETLEDVASDNVIDLTSVGYGVPNNRIWVKVEAGVVSGKKVTEKFGTVENTTSDILQNSFTLQYTGAGDPAVCTISSTTLTTAITGGPGSEDLSLTWALYPTITELVEAINAAANGVYTAVVSAGAAGMATNELDAVTTQNILTAYQAASNVQAMINAINDELSYITAALTSAADRDAIVNVSYKQLTGAAAGASTSTEWGLALTAAETEDIQMIGTDNVDSATTILVSTHVAKMNSEFGKNERQGVCGGETSLIASMTQAVSLNNFAMDLCWAAFKNYNVNSVLTDFTSQYYAAKVLGQKAASAINEPMTHKALNMISSTKLTRLQKKDAIIAGVTVLDVSSKGVIRTCRNITTSQSNDIKYCESSIVREMLYISKDFREMYETAFTGKAGTKGRLISVESLAIDRFIDYEDQLEIIVSDPNQDGNAWWDFSWSVTGDVLRTVFKASVVSPINFEFTTIYFDVLSTVSA